MLDRLKIGAIAMARWVNHGAIEQASRATFRRPRPPTPAMEVVAAQQVHNYPHLPDGLFVPRLLPGAAKLSPAYTLPYYYLTGAVFQALRRAPLDRERSWSPTLRRNRLFPANKEGWDHPFDDQAFADLRIWGSDPWLLRHTEGTRFEADYSALFEGIAPPVTVEIDVAGQPRPTRIHVDGVAARPGEAHWCAHKRIANALDIRSAVFGKHLLETHLVVGQAFALSVGVLPLGHPLRAFLELFTFGTLHVNHFAYRLLLGESSYFHTSHFIRPPQTLQLFRNGLGLFNLDHWRPEQDAERRGLHHISDHPLVVDGIPAWRVFRAFTGNWCDEALQIDASVEHWHHTLLGMLPSAPADLQHADGIADLLAICLYNNVVHEMAGDFSPYAGVGAVDDKRVVNLAALLADPAHAPSAADAFLFDQGAFASAFNNGGNNILSMPLPSLTHDPILAAHVRRLQTALAELDQQVKARNATRRRPVQRMEPTNWEASISF